MTVDAGGVWATAVSDGRGRLVRLDPRSMRVVAGPVDAGRAPEAVVHAGDSVWVVDRRRDTVLRYDPGRLSLRSRIAVGDEPTALAAAGEALWVANLGDRTLLRIDLVRGEVVGAPVSLGKEIEAIAGSPRTLWVAAADGTVTRVDPATGTARGRPIGVDQPPLTLAADGDAAWVTSASGQSLRRLERPLTNVRLLFAAEPDLLNAGAWTRPLPWMRARTLASTSSSDSCTWVRRSRCTARRSRPSDAPSP